MVMMIMMLMMLLTVLSRELAEKEGKSFEGVPGAELLVKHMVVSNSAVHSVIVVGESSSSSSS